MPKVIRVIDVETGPAPTEGNPGIIEFGYYDLIETECDLLGNPISWEVGQGWDTLVNPGAPVPPETSAIHNLIDEDLASAPVWQEVSTVVTLPEKGNDRIIALAAHNIECERTLIGSDITGDLPWLDTYKIALHLWPDSPSHSNGAVRYYINPKGLDRLLASPTHRAMPDAYVTAFTLREALNAGHSIETLIKWTNEPALLARLKVGKWRGDGKGTPFDQVDTGFLYWMLDKDFDENTLYTARFHIEKREMDQREQRELAELNRQYRENGLPETKSFSELDQPAPSSPAPRDTSTMEMDL